MFTPKRSLFQTVLARLSLGAIPVGGTYWFEPKATEGKKGVSTPDAHPPAPDAQWSPAGLRLSRPIRRSVRKECP